MAATGGTLVSTAPPGAADARRYGFVATVSPESSDAPARVDVVLRDRVLLSTPVADLPSGCALTLAAEPTRTTFSATGSEPRVIEGDSRPQVVASSATSIRRQPV
ncbi:hypothetical protein EN35_09140 [Rhodococcus qingshengii]|nr:hypothetical protein EN35_09140 [Rhodococcus qingshengii]